MSTAAPETSASSAPLVRRTSAWHLADQAVSSAASLMVGLFVAREAALEEIGAFAVAFGFYQLLHAVGRPLNSEPLTVQFSAAGYAEQREPAARAVGSALALGILIVPLGLVAEVVVGGGTGRALAVCALFAPVFLLQDAWRYVFFTSARPALAVASDAVILASLVPVTLLFQELMGSRGATFVAAWGAATALGAATCLAFTRLWPRVQAAADWWRTTSHLARKMLVENLLVMGSYFAGVSLIAALAGSGELGRLRVTQVAFSPASFVILAAGTTVLTAGSRLPDGATRAVRRLATRMGALVLAAAGLLTALWLALPVDAGDDVLGPAWPSARTLVVPAAFYLASVGLTTVLSMGLRASKVPEQATRCRVAAAPATILAALGGALLSGPGLAILAMGAVELGCAAAMVKRLTRLEGAGDEAPDAKAGAAGGPPALLAVTRFLARRPNGVAARIAVQLLMRSRLSEFSAANIDGHRIIVDCRDHMEANALLGRHRLPDSVLSLVRVGDWTIDLGANVGIVSSQLCAAVGPDGLVSAWEPLPRNLERLRFLKSMNGLEQLSVVPYAAGAEELTATIGLGGTNRSGWNSLTASWQPKRAEVRIRRVDAVSEQHAGARTLRLIKVDVEGYEFEALEGCRGLLERHRPWLYCEFNDFVLRDRGRSAAELLDFLSALGYEPVQAPGRFGPKPRNVLLAPA